MSRRTPSAITPPTKDSNPDYKAFKRISEDPNAPLTEREVKYVEARAQGLPVKTAYRIAGFKGGSAAIVEERAKIQAALACEQAKYAAQSQLRRQDIIDGIKDAIEQAKVLADPATQIRGWRELGLLCGFYAPEVKKIELSVSAERLKSKYEAMSDAELLELTVSSGDTIDGEATRIN